MSINKLIYSILVFTGLFVGNTTLMADDQRFTIPLFDSTSRISLANSNTPCLNIGHFIQDTNLWVLPGEVDYDQLLQSNCLIFKTILPDTLFSHPAVYLHGYVNNLEIFLDSNKIFSYDAKENDGPHKYYQSFVLPIDSSFRKQTFFIQMKYNNPLDISTVFDMQLGEQSNLFHYAINDRNELLKSCIIDFIIGTFIIITGLLALLLFVARRRSSRWLYASFALFTLSSGISLIMPVLLQIINFSPKFYLYTEGIMANLIPLGYFMVFGFVSEIRTRFWANGIVAIHVVYSVLSVIFPFSTLVFYFYYILAAVEIIIPLAIIFKRRMFFDSQFKILAFLIVLFQLCYVHDLLIGLEFFPWEINTLGWGVSALIFGATIYFEKHYIKSQREIQAFSAQLELTRMQLLELENKNILSRFEALKNQVNPHFLFNSLNTLASLIKVDSKKAVNFVEEFADMYRYILDVKDKVLVSIEQELKFVKSYTYLQTLRYDKKLQVSVDVPSETMLDFIPPLSLQLLIENAIKHNEISERNPLHILIAVDGDYLVISNTLKKVDIGQFSAKIGLNNLTERYALLSDRQPVFTENKGQYIARIPIIKD